MMSARPALRHRHSLPSMNVKSPTSPVVRLRCLSLYRELNGLQDVLLTPAGTAAAAKQRTSTFCYERLVSRTGDASCDVDHGHHDDVVDEDDETRLTMTVNVVTPLLTANVAVLADSAVSVEEKCLALDELLYLVEGAWTMPVIGREVAYRVCDVLREQGGVDLLLSIMSGRTTESTNKQAGDIIVLMAAIVLSQAMSVPNREYVARQVDALETILRVAQRAKTDSKLLKPVTGIIGCLFKESEETCCRLTTLDSLDIIIYACRSLDSVVLRNCASALANLAMYGDSETQRQMAAGKAMDWLFPLAFSGDDSVAYYALIASAALAANVDLEKAAVKSGTLKLVEPFVNQHDPVQFGLYDKDHYHGQSANWLRRLVPLLKSRCHEAGILAAFHFVVEASIRKRQGKLQIFKEIGAVVSLKKVVMGNVKLASKLAARALTIMDETVPTVLSPRVPLWTTEDVSCWIHQIKAGSEVTKKIEDLQVDGDLLLLLTEKNLQQDLGVNNAITRKRLMRELDKLRQAADYTSCDRTGLAGWLSDLMPELRRYTYQMLKAGVTLPLLPQLSNSHLMRDCRINNGVHRLLISQAAKNLSSGTPAASTSAIDALQTDNEVSTQDSEHDRKHDVFISYRRQTGKHLAGLLKVYLALNGFSVYIDIESLRIGRFDENLLISIRKSTNFILVLTANALDRCIGDTHCCDWVHKEIVAALHGGCRIIPITDEAFLWPDEEALPVHIRAVARYQAIPWSHCWQDACVSKLVQYLRESGSRSTTIPSTA